LESKQEFRYAMGVVIHIAVNQAICSLFTLQYEIIHVNYFEMDYCLSSRP